MKNIRRFAILAPWGEEVGFRLGGAATVAVTGPERFNEELARMIDGGEIGMIALPVAWDEWIDDENRLPFGAGGSAVDHPISLSRNVERRHHLSRRDRRTRLPGHRFSFQDTAMKREGRVARIAGPTVVAEGMNAPFMREVVHVGLDRLMGEVIRIDGDRATLQVYEETQGLKTGDPLFRSGEQFTVELGPGLLGTIYDGVQRPLATLADKWGDFIDRGASVYRLDRERRWPFTPTVAVGDKVTGGMVVGTVA